MHGISSLPFSDQTMESVMVLVYSTVHKKIDDIITFPFAFGAYQLAVFQ